MRQREKALRQTVEYALANATLKYRRPKEGDCMRKEASDIPIPSLDAVEREIARIKYKRKYRRTIRTTIYTLITVAAAGVLIATLLLPVMKIYGSSMNPTLKEGTIVAALKSAKIERGDIIAFYYNNKLLIKRVIAEAGSWVNIAEDGTVFVDGEELAEPYIRGQKALGECNIELPCQVPDGRLFVMGDQRESSIDSRNAAVGCVAEEAIVGRLFFTIWPLDEIGVIN